MNLLLIASLTLREASRRRLVITAALVTVALVALTAWGFHALAAAHDRAGHPVDRHDVLVAASALEVVMAFMFSFVLALSAAFLGVLSVGAEIENGTLLAILPRPVRRVEVLAGKWLGNAVILAGYGAIMASLEFLAVYLTTGYLPPSPFLTIVFLIAQALLVLTLTMALSVRLSAMAAGFLTVVLFGVAWIAGIVHNIASVLHNDTVREASILVSLLMPTDALWQAASFSLEPAIVRAASAATAANAVNPLSPSAPPPAAYFIWCTLWVVVVAASGAWSFQRRDI